MAKLKFKNLSGIGDVLTSEELKHIYGGEDGSGSKKCVCYYTLWKNTEVQTTGSEEIPNVQSQSMCESMCEPLCNYPSRDDCEGKYF